MTEPVNPFMKIGSEFQKKLPPECVPRVFASSYLLNKITIGRPVKHVKNCIKENENCCKFVYTCSSLFDTPKLSENWLSEIELSFDRLFSQENKKIKHTLSNSNQKEIQNYRSSPVSFVNFLKFQ